MPDKPTLSVPHIYATAEKIVIYGGKPEELVPLGDPWKALVMCLAIYYIKNIHYPLAIAQPLILLQKLLLPKDTVPRGLMNGKLKAFLGKLGQ